jgi:DUF4097 and DUF4098 domain-containing protein YvlB
MRRRSVAGPLILILIGGLFLIYNIRPDVPVASLIAVWWPVLLILWGMIRVAEVTIAYTRGVPYRGALSGGETVLVVFICLLGAGMYSAHRHGFRFGGRGIEMFGQNYDYPVELTQPAGAVRRVVFESLRGNLRVTGGDPQEIRVAGHKSVRAISRGDAEKSNGQTPVQITVEGDAAVVRTNLERVPDNQSISTDLDVMVPRGVSVEVRGSRGDYDITEVSGDVRITGDRSDVRIDKIGGSARVNLRRSDVLHIAGVKGNVDIEGRGGNVELQEIAGQVTISGAYSGTLEFSKLAKPLRFESSSTDLRVAALPGEISMNLGDFTARDVVGPIHLVTRTKDVRIESFVNELDLETERGDIQLIPNRVPLSRIQARSRAGTIDLTIPPKAIFQLDASTARGDAVNDFGPPIQKATDGRSASLKGETGKGPTIHLTTERGGISVRKAGVGTAEAEL